MRTHLIDMKYLSIVILAVLFSLSPNIQAQKTKNITLKGQFESKQGVMDMISCYCGKGGYLTTNDGQEYALCFDKVKDERIRSGRIEVKGIFKTIKISSNGACPGGSKKIFQVKSYEKITATQVESDSKPDLPTLDTLVGQFESKQGVMNKVSCYCGKGGYLTTTSGQRYTVCLDAVKEERIRSGRIQIIGTFQTKTISSNGACPEGTLKIFQAVKYKRLPAASVSQEKETETKEVTITGTFDSKQGVMNRVSCFCYKSGYITTKEGKRYAVCFKQVNEEEIICNGTISVKGHFKTIEIKSNGACSAGKMEMLFAQSYRCLASK